MLKIENITVKFGGLTAVKKMNLEVKKGEIHSLIGPNGAGKTTLFNVVTRVIPPFEGAVEYRGISLLHRKANTMIHSGIARTFQNLELFQFMTVYENLYSGVVHQYQKNTASILLNQHKNFQNEVHEKIMKIAELFRIKRMLYYYPSQLSYGILKRVEIARALISEPEILLLDEPAAGLNHDETKDLDSILRLVNQQGVTILMVEHDMNLVMKISDFITVMNFGEKIAEGKPEEVANNKEVIKVYLGEENVQ